MMGAMWTRAFWLAAAERAVKGAAAAMLLVVGGGQLNALTVDWQTVLGFGAGGAVVSLLMSVGSNPFGPGGSPSLVPDPAAGYVPEHAAPEGGPA